MTTTLITSASYVSDELAAEYGRLPAAFLPLGHNRLYDLQAARLGGDAYLTLPESYVLPPADADRLTELGLAVVTVPDGLSLGNSVLYALDVIGDCPTGVRILHGDTVIDDLPAGADVLAIGKAPDAYQWGSVSGGAAAPSDDSVLAGYFAFADAAELRRSLAIARGDFLAAIERYRRARAMDLVEVSQWRDFGHLQTYYRSRCTMRTQRAFNALEINFQSVEKRSDDAAKIDAEARWFESIPSRLRLYTPAYLGRLGDDAGDGAGGYRTEYLPMPSLHELLVFGDVGEPAWRRIVEGCFAFMDSALTLGEEHPGEPVMRQLSTAKTLDRLEHWSRSSGMPLDREWRYAGKPLLSLAAIAEQTGALIDMATRDMLGIMHGDLCFTNLFFDFRTQRIKAIDPRGSIDGSTPAVHGDLRYDMAKLGHSIFGGYDFILAGRYACCGLADGDVRIDFPAESALSLVAGLAGEFSLRGRRLTDPEISAIVIHLFLSMLPLHADRPARQEAFLANALRLFSEGPGR